jgi:hypothetical protein
MSAPVDTDFLRTAIARLRYYKSLGDKAMAGLQEKDFHYKPGEESNSIAVIIKHLHGNMLSRWKNFLTEDGEKSWRNRDDEFNEDNLPVAELQRRWEEGWQCFLDALSSLQDSDLGRTVYIRKEPLSVVDAINRQLAHYPYHIGQLVYLSRMLQGANWTSLSIPRGGSQQYNESAQPKDPAARFRQP